MISTITASVIPKYCYPIDLRVDVTELIQSVNILLSRLGLNLNEINEQCKETDILGYAINLTHLPDLTGDDRWKKHIEGHLKLQTDGVNEKDFTEYLEESRDLLIGKLIRDIYNFHDGKFQGRAQLVWLRANTSYAMHRDLHTPNRYHIPIITHKDCFWIFKQKNNFFKLHMPADGRIWYVDSVNIEHTFQNSSPIARLHLILTSSY